MHSKHGGIICDNPPYFYLFRKRLQTWIYAIFPNPLVMYTISNLLNNKLISLYKYDKIGYISENLLFSVLTH